MFRLLLLTVVAATLASTLLPPSVSTATASPRTAPVVVRTGRDGFAWGDAGIGAAAALGVVLAAAGVLFLKGDRNDP